MATDTAPRANAAETLLYEAPNARITNKRAVLGGKTYAMNQISSVSMSEKAPSRFVPILLLGAGVIAVWMSIYNNSAPDYLVAALLIAGGIFWVWSHNTSYIVRIGSASGETDGLASPNRAEIQKVVDAMNEAIIQR